MNYEGYVSSINSTLCTFQLDNELTVHWAHLVTHNNEIKLPILGEYVKILNCHYNVTDNYSLERLFLCEKSRIMCKHRRTYSTDSKLLVLMQKYNLGASDLLEIVNNLTVIENSIKSLVQQSSEDIIFDTIECMIKSKWTLDTQLNPHKCLNKVVRKFNIRTISNCRYTSTPLTSKCPPWSFGVHSKESNCDILIGHLQINKRFGLILLYDNKHQMPCLITSKVNLNKNDILNKFVLIKDYTVFTESYKECNAPDLEYILFDVSDVIVLNLHTNIVIKSDVLVQTLPEDFSYVSDFEFELLKKGSVGINESIESWLEILVKKDSPYQMYLGLNAYQVRIVPFLMEGETYRVYHSEKLVDLKNVELQRLNCFVTKKFDEQNALFVHCGSSKRKSYNSVLSVVEAKEAILETNECISFQGILSVKKLIPALASRTDNGVKRVGFGTPGSHTHTLIFVDDSKEHNLLLYINNWENLQIPIGLIPNMRIAIRNVIPQKSKYLKCSALTTFEVLSYEPTVFFDTAILNENVFPKSKKFSFLGCGNLIPANVLIWAKILQLHIRSLRIECKRCDINLEENQDISILPTLTLYVYDEMGESLIISKSSELLRLLLRLELEQWKIWCCGFQKVKEFVYDKECKSYFSYDSDINAFCEALTLAVSVINMTKLVNLELLCRKLDNSVDDNEGMPLWYCIDARKKDD